MIVGGPLLGLAGDPAPGLAALARYRDDFRPTAGTPEPWVAISLDVLVADTPARAEELLLPEAWAMAQARTTGTFPPLEPVAAIRSRTMTAPQRRYVEEIDDVRYVHNPGIPAWEGDIDIFFQVAADAYVREAMIEKPEYILAASNYLSALPALTR